MDDQLQTLQDTAKRVGEVLDASGQFWVEAQETDGLEVIRLTVSDRSTGKWMTVEIELSGATAD